MAIGHWLKNFTKWYFDPGAESGGGGGQSYVAFNINNNGFQLDEIRPGGTIVVPAGIAILEENLFRNSLELKRVFLPESIRTIGGNAFQNCPELEVIKIPPGSLTRINNGAFKDCTSLTQIRLPETVTTMEENIFSGCTNLRIISCGFAEGSVSGAPWGAGPQTTINYNV